MGSLFSTTLRVPVGTLHDLASKLGVLADDNEDVFDRMLNALDLLETTAGWRGEDEKALRGSVEAYKKEYEKSIKGMRELKDFIEKFAQEINEKDLAIKRNIESV